MGVVIVETAAGLGQKANLGRFFSGTRGSCFKLVTSTILQNVYSGAIAFALSFLLHFE